MWAIRLCRLLMTLAQGSVLVWNTADIPRGNDGYIPNGQGIFSRLMIWGLNTAEK